MKTIQVEDELWRWLRARAFEREETIGAVVESAVRLLKASVESLTPRGSVAEKNGKGGVVPVPGDEADPSSVSARVTGSASGRSSQMGSEETGRASSRGTDPLRCACGHLETVHRQGKRCEFPHCECRGFAPSIGE